jgi:hypothetical protein
MCQAIGPIQSEGQHAAQLIFGATMSGESAGIKIRRGELPTRNAGLFCRAQSGRLAAAAASPRRLNRTRPAGREPVIRNPARRH